VPESNWLAEADGRLVLELGRPQREPAFRLGSYLAHDGSHRLMHEYDVLVKGGMVALPTCVLA